MNKFAYFILRWMVGFSMLGHGLVRLPKLPAFASHVSTTFAESILPQSLVYGYAYVIALTELIIGILLVLGLFTKQASLIGAILMISLIFGSCLIENFGVLTSQMVHGAIFALLLQFAHHDVYALDQRLFRKKSS